MIIQLARPPFLRDATNRMSSPSCLRARLISIALATLTPARILTAQTEAASTSSAARAPATSATTADFAWLAGTWEGNLAGSAGMVAALTFQPPAAGSVSGVMRLRQGDKLVMLELIAMIDTPRGVELRFRHFTGALDALETTFKQNMLLKSHEPAKDTFENLAEYDKTLMSTQPRTSAWIRRGPDEMVAHSDIIGSDGKPAVIEVVYRRVK
jgi:hypothetical protein